VIDKYCYRPAELKDINLWQFVAEYEEANKAQRAVDRGSDCEDADEEMLVREVNAAATSSATMRTMDGKYVRKRLKKAIVKTHQFDKKKETEEYSYSLLLLFMPFRVEAELLHGFNSAVEALLAKKDFLVGVEELGRLDEVTEAMEKAKEYLSEKGYAVPAESATVRVRETSDPSGQAGSVLELFAGS
jgi:hypothetical protein